MNPNETSKKDQADGTLQNYNEKEADTVSNTIHVLDTINKQIKAAERRLNDQRVNTAVLIVEMATLHDPLLREKLALCTHASAQVAQQIAECREIQEQVPQAFQSGMLQVVVNCKPQEIQGSKEPQSPQSDSSQILVNQDPNNLSHDSQPPLTQDSQGIQEDSFNKHCNNLQVEGAPPKHPKLIDGPPENVSDTTCQRIELFSQEKNKPAVNGRLSVNCETPLVGPSDLHSYLQGTNGNGEEGTPGQFLQNEPGLVLNLVPHTETNKQSDEHHMASNKELSDFANGNETAASTDSVPVQVIDADESPKHNLASTITPGLWAGNENLN